jgi:biotin carboxyl carrier protein
MESMKMQLEIAAPGGGTVAEVAVSAGQAIPGPELLARLDLDPSRTG